MKTGKITIEVPLPDEAELKDAVVLADWIKQLALTSNPTKALPWPGGLSNVKVFGVVTSVKLIKPSKKND